MKASSWSLSPYAKSNMIFDAILNDFEKALAVFKLNVDYHTSSSNVYDSFAEAQLASGDTL